jgi:hypothetical protein
LEYDYKTYPVSKPFEEELMSVVHHPQNIPCFHALGFDDEQVFPYDPCAKLKVRKPLEFVEKETSRKFE